MTQAFEAIRVGCLGMGWWSDVLADAMQRSGKLKIRACYTRSTDKRAAFAKKYDCHAAPSYEAMLADPTIDAIVNTTPNNVHLQTTLQAAAAGKHVFLDKPIANTLAQGRAITQACRDAGVFGRIVNAEANISRDRLGKIDLNSWRYQASGMPGGVMLQIGVHYVDVLEYLIGPVRSVSAHLAQLVLPGDNPDVASMILEHESGALSTVNASYASAAEHYVMNIYGKEASAFYDLHGGLRFVRRGAEQAQNVPFTKNDTFVDELEEFAAAVRGMAVPETGGEYATRSLGVIRAGIVSAREGRRVTLAEVLADPQA